jgi:hypothetical protein
MAEHKVEGGTMLLFIDPTGGDDYDTVVCLTSVSKSDSISVVDASSACGPDKSPGTLELSYAFEGQHLQDPDSGKISGTDLRILLRGEQTIGWMIAPEDPQNGDEIEEGTGYLSELSSTYSFDSVGTFTGTIQPYGTPTLSISGGGGGLVVGQAYQGGTIAYLNEAGDHGIIVAWTNTEHSNVWGGESVTGATANALYGGLANTNLIEGAWATSAGWDTRQLTTGGYSDWCLPTIADWDAITPNCATLGINVNGTYWTCVESSATNAYGYEPIYSDEINQYKGGTYAYIAVRYF